MKKQASGSNRTSIRITIAVLIVVFLFAGFLDYPSLYNRAVDTINKSAAIGLPHYWDLPFQLGLDLRGGTHLVYIASMDEIPNDDREDALEGVRDVIERRVNAFGVAEPLIQTARVGDSFRVIVELAGISDVNEAINMIGETPILEFKIKNDEPARELTDEEYQQIADFNADAEKRSYEILEKVQANPENFESLAREFSEHEISQARGGDLDFISNRGQYEELYAAIKDYDVGTILEVPANMFDYYYVTRIEEKRAGEEQVKVSHLLVCYEGAVYCESTLSKDDARTKIEEIKGQATTENFDQLVRDNSTEPGAEDSGGDLGYFGRGEMVPAFEEMAYNMETGTISDVVETDFGFHILYKTDQRFTEEIRPRVIAVKKMTANDIVPPAEEWKATGLSGKHLGKSQVQFDQNTNEVMVGIEFNSEGKDLFKELTEQNINEQIAIVLDGEVISAPRVNEPIRDGRAVISGDFDINEAKLLAQRLNAGALPVPIALVSEQTIGPTLGEISLSKTLNAAYIGFLLIALFMIIYYRLPGLISVISLLFYLVIVLAIFKLLPVTLTLSGLAGLILSLGMAVDANVLIFERLKEEIKSGRTLGSAIDEGFKRAWTSIRDGNITTLIACIILFWFSSSVIKGFALTLGIGVLVSMITAVTVSRVLLKLVAGWKPIRKRYWLFGAKPQEE